ncbi:hypothetical protein CapIbe_003870 [Capra ibex]
MPRVDQAPPLVKDFLLSQLRGAVEWPQSPSESMKAYLQQSRLLELNLGLQSDIRQVSHTRKSSSSGQRNVSVV